MPFELDLCSSAFEKLELQRAEVVAEVDRWPPGCVGFRTDPGTWSAVEVLDHIVRAEAGTIVDVRRGLEHPHPVGSEVRPGISALERALRSDRSFKVPPGAEEILPDAHTTLSEVASRWEVARAELRSIVKSLAPNDVYSGVFCHPFAGWMTMAEVLDHFSAHLYHHSFQLERLRTNFVVRHRD